jgi:hypothetical protein
MTAVTRACSATLPRTPPDGKALLLQAKEPSKLGVSDRAAAVAIAAGAFNRGLLTPAKPERS